MSVAPRFHSREHKVYIATIAAICLSLLLGTLLVNLLIDPLWFWKGNQVTGKNFAFNERQAKVNYLLKHKADYDCIIFGSSRTTLFQASSIPNHNCFNMSFSGGQVQEFIAFALYLRHFQFSPKLVIVGVDGFNFLEGGSGPLSIPEFVQKGRNPPDFLSTYLTVDALVFSLKTLLDSSPLTRYYTANFEGAIRHNAPKFRPEISLDAEGLRRYDIADPEIRSYDPGKVTNFRKLLNAFPGATIVAYVPPISAWHIAQMEQSSVLKSYITALHACSRLFPIFLDFSIPSSYTWRTDNTYDGSHYSKGVNQIIARRLFSNDGVQFGVSVHELDLGSYARLYHQALTSFHHTRTTN